MSRPLRHHPYDAPSGGWGSMQSLVRHASRQQVWGSALGELPRQNKPDGFMCVSCA